MTPAAFKRSLAKAVPSKALAPALQALWWAGKGDWDKAHCIVMDEQSQDAAWVHAYLHRAEGDEGNAAYWYRQARRIQPRRFRWQGRRSWPSCCENLGIAWVPKVAPPLTIRATKNWP